MENEVPLSPIEHSFKKDSASSARVVVGSNEIPEEEALLLASMHSDSVKKRRRATLSILGIIFISVSLILIFTPLKKTEENPFEEKIPVSSLIRTDASYQIDLPNESELESMRSKTFTGANGISSIDIKINSVSAKFNALSPLVSERFLKNLEGANVTDYMYGLYTNESKTSFPFIAISTDNHEAMSSAMLQAERTMYTDLGFILHLSPSSENETRRFESNTSVRNPLRELKNVDSEVILLYGFPREDLVLITTNEDAYNAIKARILAGY